MNYEHDGPQSDPEPDPRHHADAFAAEPERDTTGDAYVAHIVAYAPTPDTARAIAEAYDRHGVPFAIYLSLDGVDKYVRDFGPDHQPVGPATIEADFRDVYYGYFADRETLVDDTIASFDWGVELNQLLRDHPDLRRMVTFDRDAIWEFVQQHYEVVNGVHGLYAFERWP
jgi:hypothetical protein